MLDFIAPYTDYMFAGSGVVFAYSLVPTAIRQYRTKASTVALSTSLLTASMLVINFLAFVSLGLWLSATLTAIVCATWSFIGLQTYIYGTPVEAHETRYDAPKRMSLYDPARWERYRDEANVAEVFHCNQCGADITVEDAVVAQHRVPDYAVFLVHPCPSQ